MDIKTKAYNIAKDYLLKDTHSGRMLKSDLGLDKFQYVWLRKVINSSLDIYVLTYNSRYPTVYIPRHKLKTIMTSSIEKVRRRGDSHIFEDFKMTPAIDITEFEGKLNNAILIVQDICGENFVGENMFESINNKIRKLV